MCLEHVSEAEPIADPAKKKKKESKNSPGVVCGLASARVLIQAHMCNSKSCKKQKPCPLIVNICTSSVKTHIPTRLCQSIQNRFG